MRFCQTPGCRFQDFHAGAHSFECFGPRKKRVNVRTCSKKLIRRQTTPSISKKKTCVRTSTVNDFQVGLDECRRAMEFQQGVRICIPKSAFSGWWEGPDMCRGRILGPCYEGRFVAEALFEGEHVPTRLTASSLMLVDTCATWRKPDVDPVRFHILKCLEHEKHANAFARAKQMMHMLIEDKVDLDGKVFVTLDGMGTNRIGMIAAIMDDLLPTKTARPTILTFEKNANVALTQRISFGFGDDVRYTGGDAEFSSKHLFAGEATPLVEHILSAPNRLLEEGTKRKIVFLNLDYCGGPPKNRKVKASSDFMDTVFTHLPALHMIAVTIARRNHADLDGTFDDYVHPPFGFRLVKTFTTNPRVLCKVYMRDTKTVRTLRIPGHWWKAAGDGNVRRVFDGVVVGKRAGMYRVFVPYDKREYLMREDAVRAYAV